VRSDLGANCAVEAGVEALAGHFRVKPGPPAKASTPLPPNPNAPQVYGFEAGSRVRGGGWPYFSNYFLTSLTLSSYSSLLE
jgi:hypothetical protein